MVRDVDQLCKVVRKTSKTQQLILYILFKTKLEILSK